jgi:hypothetical protein
MILSYLVFFFAATPSKSDHAVNFKIETVFFSRMNFGGKISLNYGAATLDSSAGFCLDRPPACKPMDQSFGDTFSPKCLLQPA